MYKGVLIFIDIHACFPFLDVPPPLPVKEEPTISDIHPCRAIHGNWGFFLFDSLTLLDVLIAKWQTLRQLHIFFCSVRSVLGLSQTRHWRLNCWHSGLRNYNLFGLRLCWLTCLWTIFHYLALKTHWLVWLYLLNDCVGYSWKSALLSHNCLI